MIVIKPITFDIIKNFSDTIHCIIYSYNANTNTLCFKISDKRKTINDSKAIDTTQKLIDNGYNAIYLTDGNIKISNVRYVSFMPNNTHFGRPTVDISNTLLKHENIINDLIIKSIIFCNIVNKSIVNNNTIIFSVEKNIDFALEKLLQVGYNAKIISNQYSDSQNRYIGNEKNTIDKNNINVNDIFINPYNEKFLVTNVINNISVIYAQNIKTNIIYKFKYDSLHNGYIKYLNPKTIIHLGTRLA